MLKRRPVIVSTVENSEQLSMAVIINWSYTQCTQVLRVPNLSIYWVTYTPIAEAVDSYGYLLIKSQIQTVFLQFNVIKLKYIIFYITRNTRKRKVITTFRSF